MIYLCSHDLTEFGLLNVKAVLKGGFYQKENEYTDSLIAFLKKGMLQLLEDNELWVT